MYPGGRPGTIHGGFTEYCPRAHTGLYKELEFATAKKELFQEHLDADFDAIEPMPWETREKVKRKYIDAMNEEFVVKNKLKKMRKLAEKDELPMVVPPE